MPSKPTLDLRTPLVESTTIELGNGVYRKQVLPVGELNYKGRKLKFTPDYLRNIVSAHKRKAFDTVPTMLADKSNSHTMALLDGGGEVLGMEVDLDAVDPDTGKPAPGLYSTVRLSAAADEVVKDNPKVGVSVRLKENYERGDGEFFPAAMQHLLLTWDPRVAGMSKWQPVDLADDGDDAELIDLSGLVFEPPDKEGAQMPEKKATDSGPAEGGADNDALFQEFLAWQAGRGGGGEEPAETVEVDEAETGEGEDQDDAEGADLFTDADLERFATEALAAAGTEVAASDDDSDAVELSNAARDEEFRDVKLANSQLRQRLDAADYERERAELARSTGLPPSMIDLARPLLEGSGHSVELSNGDDIDAGEIVRSLISKFGETVRLLDLSDEIGQLAPPSEEQATTERRSAIASRFLESNGLLRA